MANNQIASRLVYENARAFIQSQGLDATNAVLTQSFIRSEMLVSNTTANYHVPILVNDTVNGAAFNTEKRVQLQDVHVISEIGLFLALPSGAAAPAFKLLTYPNPSTFTTSAAALYALYNGNLNIQVNNQNILPAWDLFKHYNVPMTQGAVGITAQTIFPVDQMSGNIDGFSACEPNLLLSGAANIQANLTLPGAVATVDANTRIVVIFRTILAQNVTSVK